MSDAFYYYPASADFTKLLCKFPVLPSEQHFAHRTNLEFEVIKIHPEVGAFSLSLY
jgi:hypothetical protein